MTRQILAVCRSRRSRRGVAAAILDSYFWRVGDRTWRGYASNACLERVSRDLKSKASRNLAVSLFELKGSHESMTPIFTVGRKAAFSPEGLCPVRTSSGAGAPSGATDGEIAFRSILDIAAACHDFGKASRLFQAKLRKASQVSHGIADPVRHEVVSAFMVDALMGRSTDDQAALKALRNAGAAQYSTAAHQAAEESVSVFRAAQSAGGGGSWLKFENLTPADLSDGGAWSARAAILALILSHHRLPDIEQDYSVFRTGSLVDHRHEDDLSIDDFLPAPGTPPWQDDRWKARLDRAIDRLEGIEDLEAALGALPDLAFFGRTALMLADHHGSMSSEPYPGATVDDVLLANTDRETGHGKDDLTTHTLRVAKNARIAARLVMHDAPRMPGLPIARCPEAVRAPRQAPGQFGWQHAAAIAAGRIVASRPGGFFGCILAGTGTGKTRGAPTVLAAATYNDPDPARQNLRFALGLGLRTLARQSGFEYVSDLGFSPNDVATMVGGPEVDTSRDGLDEAGGSEDRFTAFESLEVRPAELTAPVDGEETPEWLAGLGYDSDQDLPALLGEMIEKSGRKAPDLHRLLSTPILAATIDQFMPAADARRGGHVLQSLRVMSSDLILDEVDLYEPEDLSAIARLVFLSGLSGRRVIIMSASLPLDVAERLHEAYKAGWAKHADATGAPPHVNVLACGDTSGSVVVNDHDEGFVEIYEAVRGAVTTNLEAAEPLRMATILPEAKTISDVAEQVTAAGDRMHAHHAQPVGSLRVSLGLVRMTRIDHLQRLARKLPSGAARSAQEGGPDLRAYLFLHSRMPMAQRLHIERMLKRALTRKGDEPNEGVDWLLGYAGVRERIAEAGARSVSIVVVTSPVIETGNDIDFDWAILDPASLRAVLQTGGRVNRHRRLAITEPNIAVFPQPLVCVLDGGGSLSRPGVETRPADMTGVQGFALDCPRSLEGGLIDPSVLDVLDARLCLDPVRGGPWAAAEREMRERFAGGFPSLSVFLESGAARFSADYGARRRFRRSEDRSVDVMPRLRGGDIDGWSFKGKRSIEAIRVARSELEAPAEALLTPALAELLAIYAPAEGRRIEGALSLGGRDIELGEVHLDPVLGVVRPGTAERSKSD